MQDAISYIRVSSDEQADSGLGLEAQRQRIAAYCALKGLRLAEEFEDPAVSGGKPLASRPAGSMHLAAAKKTRPKPWSELGGLRSLFEKVWMPPR
jgi:DNA invertase Pin-like site-specific DNA recombinase